MTPSARLPVSVLVPTIGREELLRQCLMSILACEPPATEVVVVDQSGGTAVQAVARELGSSDVRVVRCDGRGLALARNVGLRHVSHDLVLVTDDDCTVAKDWIEAGYRLGVETPDGIVTGRVLPPDDSTYVPATKTSTEPEDFTGQARTGTLFGGNCVLRASAVAEIGGFDEREGLRFAEDTDFGYRWLSAGRRLRYQPELVVWHHSWRTEPQLVTTHVGYLRSLGAFFGKHLYAREPHIRTTLDTYLRWAIPTFANGVANRRPRWEYAERELLPHFVLGLAQGWFEARRLRQPRFPRAYSEEGRAPTSGKDGRHAHADTKSERHPHHLMSAGRRSLGAIRRRLLGLSGLDPHLASLDARSSAIEAQLASMHEAVQAQNGGLAELAEKLQSFTRAHRDSQLVAHYLATTPFPVLHLGCGELKRAGWLNTDAEPASDDIVALDMRGPYPFNSGSFSAVYTEHSIEHLDLDGGREMLTHCYRVLKPNGVLRVATPDQRQIVSLLSDDSPSAQTYLRWAYRQFNLGPPHTPALVVNNFFREWGHQLVYDELTLSELLRQVGFSDVQRVEIGHSQHPELDGAEMHGLAIGEEQNRIETMVLEATKPAR